MTLASDRPPSQLFLIGAGWWLTLLTVADLFLVPPLLPDFLHLVKIDISQAGWIAASFQAGAAAMTLAAGSLVDRFGCRHILAASMLLFSIGEALSGISNSMTRLLLGRFLVGTGSAAASLGLIALVGRQVSYQSRGVVLGWIGTAYFAGVTFGPLISTYIVHQTSLSWLLLLFSFLGFLSIGVSLVSFSELAPGSGKSQPAFSDILKNPGFWGLAIFQMLFSAGVTAMIFFFGDWLEGTYQLDARARGWVFALGGSLSLLGAPLGGWISDSLGKKGTLLALTAALSVLCCWMPYLKTWLPGVIGLFGLVGFIAASRYSAFHALTTRLAEPDQLGRLLALRNFLTYLSTGLGVVLMGRIYASGSHGYEILGWTTTICLISSMYFLWKWVPQEEAAPRSR